jgi:hypothetical protein
MLPDSPATDMSSSPSSSNTDAESAKIQFAIDLERRRLLRIRYELAELGNSLPPHDRDRHP